jgi:hypothetical protein
VGASLQQKISCCSPASIPFPVPTSKGFFNRDPFGHCRVGRLTGAHRCVPIPLQHCPFRTLRPASSNKTSTAPGPRCLCVGAWERGLLGRSDQVACWMMTEANGLSAFSKDIAGEWRQSHELG